MRDAFLADLVLLLHVAYVAFVVGGLPLIWLGCALGWRWVRNWRFRVLHLAAIAFVAVEAVVGAMCPLTVLEDTLRPGEARGTRFVERWLHAILFWDWPLWAFTAVYIAFTVIVAATLVLLPPRSRRSRHGQ